MNAPVAFVAGWPVAQARSPLIHRFWLDRHGLAGDYVRAPVRREELAAFLSGLGAAGYVGGNLTIPHKEAAFRLCDELMPPARRMGAVNTVWLEGGRLCGDNTDGHGFAANLDDRAPRWREGAEALVIGAGGAARAVVDAIGAAGYARISMLNRSPDRAHTLARVFKGGVRGGGLDELDPALPSADLIVNTTSAEMGGSEALRVDWRKAKPGAVVADIVYVPLETPYLREAAAAGLTTVDGLGMLLHQAAPGFERWFGLRPVVDDALRRAVMADLAG